MRLPIGSTFALATGDLDRDGDPDFVQANWGWAGSVGAESDDTVYFNK